MKPFAGFVKICLEINNKAFRDAHITKFLLNVNKVSTKLKIDQ